MGAEELLELLEESFGPPEMEEWFQILNDCAKGLVKKHTRMGKLSLDKKGFQNMVAKHPPLTKYLPLYILRSDFQKYTLGAKFFAKQNQIENVPRDFLHQTFKLSQGEIGRMRFAEKNKDRMEKASKARERERMRRTTEGMTQLKKEDHSVIRTSKRQKKNTRMTPKEIMQRSQNQFASGRSASSVRRRKNHRVAEKNGRAKKTSEKNKISSETAVVSLRRKKNNKVSPMEIMEQSRKRFLDKDS